MKSIKKVLMVTGLLLSAAAMQAQIKNAKTTTASVKGNCKMCQRKIEKSGSIKDVAMVTWDQKSQQATLVYDANATTQDEILKRIATAGYDSDHSIAPENVYKKLPSCCKYREESK